MPEPTSKNAIIDIYSYKLLNKFSLYLIKHKLNISPNAITLLQIPVLYYLFIFTQKKDILGSFLCALLTGILDNLDGTHARNTNKVSKIGIYLDHYMDQISIFVIIYINIKSYFKLNKINNILLSSFLPLYVIINCDPKHEFKNKLFLFAHDNTILIKVYFWLFWYMKSIKKKSFLLPITALFSSSLFFS